MVLLVSCDSEHSDPQLEVVGLEPQACSHEEPEKDCYLKTVDVAGGEIWYGPATCDVVAMAKDGTDLESVDHVGGYGSFELAKGDPETQEMALPKIDDPRFDSWQATCRTGPSL